MRQETSIHATLLLLLEMGQAATSWRSTAVRGRWGVPVDLVYSGRLYRKPYNTGAHKILLRLKIFAELGWYIHHKPRSTYIARYSARWSPWRAAEQRPTERLYRP